MSCGDKGDASLTEPVNVESWSVTVDELGAGLVLTINQYRVRISPVAADLIGQALVQRAGERGWHILRNPQASNDET